MMSEFRKSINAILFERMASPLYGAFGISWLIWNWKAIYLTLFVSESKINGTKIEYIIQNYSSTENLVIYPIISTIIIILIIPFVANGAYWTSLKFKNWRLEQKNSIEKKQLLTIEQSAAIRKELKEKEFQYEELIQKREKQIEELNQIINEYQKSKDSNDKIGLDLNESNKEFEKLKSNKKAFEYFEKSYKSIDKDEHIPSDVPDLIKEYYVVNGIFNRHKYASGGFYYSLTSLSKDLYRNLFNEKYQN